MSTDPSIKLLHKNNTRKFSLRVLLYNTQTMLQNFSSEVSLKLKISYLINQVINSNANITVIQH